MIALHPTAETNAGGAMQGAISVGTPPSATTRVTPTKIIVASSTNSTASQNGMPLTASHSAMNSTPKTHPQSATR